MQKRTLLIGSGVAVVLGALLLWAFAPRPIEVEVATATTGSFTSTIDEDGKTRLRDAYVVSAPLAGRLARITLREGDTVAAGAVIATLTPALAPMLDARASRELQARVAAARAVVERAAARISRAQVALEQADSELRRSRQLAQQGFVAATKLESDQLAVSAAQKELDTAVQEQHVAGHELEQARAAAARTRSAAAAAGAPSAGFAVQAPIAGRVLHVLQSSEAVVSQGAPLIELGDTARMEVVAELLTTDAVAAQPGMRVLIERWGGPTTLEGRVRAIEPAAFTKVSALGVEEQRVKVLIDITSAPSQWLALGDGFRVAVRIVTLEQSSALMVPTSAVFPHPQPAQPGAMAVFVLERGRAQLVPVRLGARNGSQAWITGGLSAGASVIVYPPATVRDGSRVQARRV